MQVANPKSIGERTEGIVLAELLRRGHVVLMPFGNNQRYDLVLDLGNGNFLRGQCKTAVYRNGCVLFYACSTSGGGKKKGYRNQIEVFWVYCPEIDKIFQVPVSDVGETQVTLRVEEPKPTAPRSTIRWAADYEMK